MRGVVVGDQMNVELGRHRRFNGAKETDKLLMSRPLPTRRISWLRPARWSMG
jgi:hypothetical protein